jgi:hypothetical protein
MLQSHHIRYFEHAQKSTHSLLITLTAHHVYTHSHNEYCLASKNGKNKGVLPRLERGASRKLCLGFTLSELD